MRRILLAAVVSLGFAAPAMADTIEVLKANTLVLTAQDGGTTTVLIGEDGKMEQVNSSGMWAAGFWSDDGGRFCWTARGAAQVCIPLPVDKAVGDTWQITGPTGRVIWTAEIQEGRAEFRADVDAVGDAIVAAAAVDAAGGDRSGH